MGSRSPFSSTPMTSLFSSQKKGCFPKLRISHMHTANIQTSLAVVKRRKLMDSGDIHLMGRRVTEAL